MSELDKVNKEYVDLIIQMRDLNKKRSDIFRRFKELSPNASIPPHMHTISIYHDLYGNDLDKMK